MGQSGPNNCSMGLRGPYRCSMGPHGAKEGQRANKAHGARTAAVRWRAGRGRKYRNIHRSSEQQHGSTPCPSHWYSTYDGKCNKASGHQNRRPYVYPCQSTRTPQLYSTTLPIGGLISLPRCQLEAYFFFQGRNSWRHLQLSENGPPPQ